MDYLIREYDDGRTPDYHSKSIFKQYLLKLFLKSLMGKKDSGMPIIVDDTLKGKPGDKVTFHFIPQDDSDPIIGQNKTITGNEKSLDEYIDFLKLEIVSHAFKKKGKMTDKRIIWDWRGEVKKQLSNWFSKRSEVWLFDAMTGLLTNGLDYLAANKWDTTALVNGEGRCVMAKGADNFEIVPAASSSSTKLLSTATGGMSLVPADKMNSYLLDSLSICALEGNSDYPMIPIKMNSNGKEMFVLILSTQAARDLKQDTRYEKRRDSIISAGIDPAKDPIATGALGIWENIILKESPHIRKFKGGNNVFARNLLLGANAATLSYAQTMNFSEEKHDYGREIGFAADEIRGQKKLVFDGVDQGVMQVISASNLKSA